MSPKTTRLPVGLTALGLFGFAAILVAGADVPPAPSGLPATPAVAPANAPSATTVLLLNNGRILRGDVAEEGPDYVLRRKEGVIRFRKDQVEKSFESMAALYAYKCEQVNERDPDEHLKLARWCLSQNMRAEAKAELQRVVKLSPKSGEAKAMMASIEAAEARGAGQVGVDRQVVQTAGEAVARGGRTDRPAELDAALIRNANKALGVSGAPVIFDLPPAIAYKRAEHFARWVHPVLQSSCAKCHNEKHQGTFQLIEVKSRKAMTPAVVRANLDFTLNLVDQNNLGKSELLSSSLTPHPGTSNGRPIFGGSNDPRFQILSAWVQSLQSAPNRATEGVAQTRPAANDTETGGGFASDRSKVPLQFSPTPANVATGNVIELPKVGSDGLPANARRDVIVKPATRYVQGQGMVTEKTPPTADEFPDPFMRGGPPVNPNAAAPPAGAGTAGAIPTPSPPPSAPLSPPGTLPELPPTAGSVDPKSPDASKPKEPSKPVKIPTDLLQRALMNRNNGR